MGEEKGNEGKNGRSLLFMLAALAVVIIGGTVLYRQLGSNGPGSVSSSGEVSPRENGAAGAGGQEEARTADNQAEPAGAADSRIPAVDFIVTDGDGNEVSLSDFAGRPVVLNFWASWCPPCKSEMPEFDKVYGEMGEEIVFMMVDAVDGGRETVESGSAYIAEQGYSFPVYYDVGQQVIAQYGIRAFPSTLFVDSEGYAVLGYQGAINETILREGIELIRTEKE